MAEFKRVKGDMFVAGYDLVLNPVNCLGISGAGLAKAFARRFPEQQKAFEKFAKEDRRMTPGVLLMAPAEETTICYFPTKNHWKDPSEYEYIRAGIDTLRKLKPSGLIAIPALGCGLGGLDWDIVREIIEEGLGGLPELEVHLYDPK